MDSIKTLDFDKIRLLLAKHAVTVSGKKRAEDVLPAFSPVEVKLLQEQTKEAFALLEEKNSSPIIACSDVSAILPRITVGAQLSFGELLKMASFLRAIRVARGIVDNKEDAIGNIYDLARALVPIEDLENEIFACILSDTEIADCASVTLATIRRKIKNLSESIKDRLNAVLKNLENNGLLQENIITIRNDRYVLPVLAGNKSKVPGIVHDQSSSGATLFIEPMAVVEINNDIRKLKLDERDEIERILDDFSYRLHVFAEALVDNQKNLTELDLIFARARFARELDAVAPEINDKLFVNIIKGRHPLIDKKKVVPITVWLGKEFTQLLITGPNTGGKTVTLKTIGLFALMTQSGMFIPACAGSQMPVFDNVFADIGDEQSIQQSLSTFSSHMKKIAQIMHEVTPNTLVLFDELGAGTDPTEGAALAMSILEELRKRKIRTVVTSHYAELKAYSIERAGAENASVEFDTVDLMPTYKLLVGVPGNSNAFLISSRLGLDKYLIDRARSYVDEDAKKLNKVLTNAEEYRATAEAKKAEAAQIKHEINLQKQKMESEQIRFEKQREKLLEKANKEADQIREKALAEANKIIENMKQLADQADPSAIFKAREERKKLNKKQIEQKTQQVGKKIEEFTVGMTVYSPMLDKDGILQTLPNSKGKVKVMFDAMQMEVASSELTYSSNKKEKAVSGGIKISRAQHNVSSTIDVRGQFADEAVINVDMYLDLMLASNLSTVTIIHGKGTGALRKAINDYLKSNKRVESYRAGAYGEGDAGVTVVELKK